jgi:hypothetical protein
VRDDFKQPFVLEGAQRPLDRAAGKLRTQSNSFNTGIDIRPVVVGSIDKTHQN